MRLRDFSIPAAKLVGPAGKVYAADIHKLAVRQVQKKASMKGHSNVHAIQTDCNTELPNASIDVVFLFHVPHDFKNLDSIITELDRVLKPKGLLSVIDHKFDNDKVVSTFGHAARDLKLREGGVRDRKRKETVLIFSKGQ
jgi:ubiquinone/menaquinone biosynthesis C-methylase UbiE